MKQFPRLAVAVTVFLASSSRRTCQRENAESRSPNLPEFSRESTKLA
jgi:hypothetical protein